MNFKQKNEKIIKYYLNDKDYDVLYSRGLLPFSKKIHTVNELAIKYGVSRSSIQNCGRAATKRLLVRLLRDLRNYKFEKYEGVGE